MTEPDYPKLEALEPDTRVHGLVPGQLATIIAARWHDTDTLEVVFEGPDGNPQKRLLSRGDEPRLRLVSGERPWTLDADGAMFRLASEARRIQLAHLFDPYVAIDAASIEPLPHQIEAVYEELLPRQPLRFLLADDPGAGKTIMSGLYIRELVIRGDVERCLVVAPGSLVEQWQDELWQKFQLPFDILSRDMVEAARTGNPFTERRLLIARLDQLSRNEDLQTKLGASEWDLIVVDEAHKMSAHLFGGEVEKTKRFRLGEQLRDLARHFLLLTATPHNGKNEDFQLFLSLLDPDRFAASPRITDEVPEPSDLMRRYVKESLLTFDGRRLFPERRAITVKYELSPMEKGLYDAVSEYVRTGMNRAERLQEGGERRRGLAVGFALTALQRRLASSPEAIYRSLQRRRERLETRLHELTAGRSLSSAAPARIPDFDSLDDFDFDEYTDEELEELEDDAIDEATAAETIEEVRAEIAELQALEKLAQAVRSSGSDKKWEELRSILLSEEMTRATGVRRKLIVFSEHRDTLNYLERRIRSLLGRPEAVVTIHGGMHREDRRRTQEAFTTDPDVQILVATDAAGEGVNLQRANLMVNYDLPWNPNRIEQRFGRIHRIGQEEACHLWNLVAIDTREGQVFDRLFTKIEQQRGVFGDQVYDVLGDAVINRSLRELLIEAIRFGERPEAALHLQEVIDGEIGTRFQEVIDERALSADLLNRVRIQEIRDQIERAKARKLQPGFIRAFFEAALVELGGRIVEREANRFEITRVPAPVRSREREITAGGPIHPVYERVVFDRDLVKVEGKPPAELLAPGHPLLTAVIDAITEKHGGLLQQGAVFVDPDDPSDQPRALVYLEHEIQDGRPGPRGRRTVSRRFQFVEIDLEGTVRDPGPAPYLDYQPATDEERQSIADLLEDEWVSTALGDQARSYAITALAGPHFAEIQAVTEVRVQRVRQAVEERLNAEIRYWDKMAYELKQMELQGKRRGGMTSGHARNRAEEMEARKERRLRELAQERDLSNQPPVVVGGAVVIPQGLLDRRRLGSDPQRARVKDVEAVDRRAVAAVMAAEKALGREPVEMDHSNPGYDIESRDPETGTLYFIEVKGRIEGEDTVTVKARQIRHATNNPDTFRLALVIVPEDETAEPTVRYLLRPFEGREPRFGVVSETFSLPQLLSIAQEPA